MCAIFLFRGAYFIFDFYFITLTILLCRVILLLIVDGSVFLSVEWLKVCNLVNL